MCNEHSENKEQIKEVIDTIEIYLQRKIGYSRFGDVKAYEIKEVINRAREEFLK